MDSGNTTLGKQKLVTISRTLAFVLIALFLACIAATALLVYNLSPCAAPAPPVTSQPVVQQPDKHSLDSPSKAKKEEITTTLPPSEIEDNVTTSSISSTSSSPLLNTQTQDDNLRLPTFVIPHSYNIELIPFIQEGNFTFHGRVSILVNVSHTCDNITLHSIDLIIDKVLVETTEQRQFISIKSIANDTKRQFLIIHLDEELSAGKQYYVTILFKGVLNDLLQGFYRSSYKVNNETRWVAITQFQTTDARRAFPCFDEPIFKAKFQISIAHFKNMTSISNMPKLGLPQPVKDLPDYVWDRYQESLPMSTYLVAFVVSDFQSLTNGTMSVWARKSALSQTKFSLEVGPKILSFYEDFFGIKYPLPKLDMIGLPDFSAGAMENWGLITYRESVLLYEDKVSSKDSKQRIAHVIAHELAHQWFGNLVTPVWWSDLWLNEGFATYAEYIGADIVNPELKELDQFLINELHGALSLDALKSSHQISIPVNNPDEINDIFDRISYSKGAAIVRMLQHFLSMEVFRKGLNNYLRSKMYQNAEQDDLWSMLTQHSHETNALDKNTTIKTLMDTWTLQTGFPVVQVQRNFEDRSVRFSQKRFLLSNVTSNGDTLWWIPITYKGLNTMTKTVSMPSIPEVRVENIPLSDNEWLLVNVNQTGYYRVNYDLRNWELIITQLTTKHTVFDQKNRAQIIDDTLNLASAGYLDYTVALNVTRYLKKERDFVPWKAAFVGLDRIQEMFIRTAHFDLYKNYMLDLLHEMYQELGFTEKEGDTQLTIYNRFEVYSRACDLGVFDCIIKAVNQFENWKSLPNPDGRNLISENMRQIVYCTAIKVGGQEVWDFAWQRYLRANVESEKETLLFALGCSRETWLLSRFLEWSLTENSGIRKHDTSRVFAVVANNPIGQELAYRFLKTNWDRLRTYFGPASMSLSSVIRSCTHKFNTEVELKDFKNFVKEKEGELGIALRTAHQSIEQQESNVNWMNTHFRKISQWLSTRDT